MLWEKHNITIHCKYKITKHSDGGLIELHWMMLIGQHYPKEFIIPTSSKIANENTI